MNNRNTATFGLIYNPNGNRVAATNNAEAFTYFANALNQYTNLQSNSLQPVNLSYDSDGNLLTNGVWSYTWDAENRLAGVLSNGVAVVMNVFEYFWGMDLSGTLPGAGGVGGLLAVSMNGYFYFPLYDNNGKITDYVDASGNIRAHYEYSPLGETVAQSGDLADTFRFRFSTKYWDEETRSYYYGYRFYSPELGRWLSKDPIGELGGLNLYGFSGNDAVNHIDYLGKLKKEFKKLAEGEMIFAGTFGSVEPGLILTHECKCKNVKYDLQFHYKLRILSKTDTEGWKETPKEYPGESLDNWGTWTINQKYAFILGHEEKHVYWWRVFFDATVTILAHQESQEFASYEACNKYSEQVIDGVYMAYDAYNRKQRMHYFWEAGH